MKFLDFNKEDSAVMVQKDEEMVREALANDYGVEVTLELMNMLRLFGE
jgi:hypothetical protein